MVAMETMLLTQVWPHVGRSERLWAMAMEATARMAKDFMMEET